MYLKKWIGYIGLSLALVAGTVLAFMARNHPRLPRTYQPHAQWRRRVG